MRERGQILLFTIAFLLMIGISSFFTFLSPVNVRLREEERATKIMAEAKDALIGYAAASSVRPGQLPCPDTNNDGVAESPNGSGCPSGNLGRLPWKTLGLEDLRDSTGERLWYAVSTNFTRNPASCGSCPLNSDTKGTLTVYLDSTATVITSEAIAVLFAPGQSLGGQVRDAANVNNAINYLDTTAGINNATPSANPPLAPSSSLIKAQRSDSFNDRLMVISASQLMPVVEQRVARAVIERLEDYKWSVGVYPWADCSDGSSDVPPDYVNRGRLPFINVLPANWNGPGPAFPAWFGANYWNWVMYYAVGKMYLEGGGVNCTTCVDSQLTLTGVGTKRLVIIMTGPSTVSPPPGPLGASGVCTKSDWQPYIEDSQNLKDPANPLSSDDTFVRPSSTRYVRNRLYACPGTPGLC